VGFRSGAQRDRDRILYASAFRRLSGVTQVVLPSGEPYLFHNRLIHSIKVAQVARRLAEKLLSERKRFPRTIGGGCDPDVVEAAALAHDLGHPPFGHIAEKELTARVDAHGNRDGYEGNAQTFRILTRLSAISTAFTGLNLTRATLRAVLKYPWTRDAGRSERKWGVYRDDLNDFTWATGETSEATRTLEAEIMDWADDIAYAVHDLEDFFRAGLIPLDRFASNAEPIEPIFRGVLDDWDEDVEGAKPTAGNLEGASTFLREFPLQRPFRGASTDRANIRVFTSALVNQFVTATDIVDAKLWRDPGAVVGVAVLKQLTRQYVIESPRLATQQHGQRLIVRTLFETYMDALRQEPPDFGLFPTRWQAEAVEARKQGEQQEARAVADVIAAMTEEEAIRTHQRIAGINTGAFLDPLIS
jgi:dGTPase